MNTNQKNDDPVDLTPFLDNSLTSRVSEFLWRNIFQHVDGLFDRISAGFTRRWLEKEIKDLE